MSKYTLKDKRDLVLDEYVPIDSLISVPSVPDILIELLVETGSIPKESTNDNQHNG